MHSLKGTVAPLAALHSTSLLLSPRTGGREEVELEVEEGGEGPSQGGGKCGGGGGGGGGGGLPSLTALSRGRAEQGDQGPT